MKRTMEKAAILSLSLILVSSYSVATALPDMMNYYKGFSQSRIEQLISISSFAIMCVILLNGVISRFIRERISIICGLILIAAGGAAPVFVQSYPLVFAGRVVLGIGIGLINVHAVNMINERYTGEERAAMLGYRGAAEVLGNAVLTLIVGQILRFGWTKSFVIYFAGLPILLLFLCFVPKQGAVTEEKTKEKAEKTASKGKQKIYLRSACLGGLFICMNSACTMRIPSLILEGGMGTEVESSVVLCLMMLIGIVAGGVFGRLVHIFGACLQPLLMVATAVGMVLIAGASNIWILGVGCLIAGMALSILVTTVFHQIGEELSPSETRTATTLTLAGCNLGSSLSSLVMGAAGLVSKKMSAPFWLFALAAAVLGGIGLMTVSRDRRRKVS